MLSLRPCCLAMAEPSLRDVAEEMIERALREGTLAMKCRAREAKQRMEKRRSNKKGRHCLRPSVDGVEGNQSASTYAVGLALIGGQHFFFTKLF